MPARDIALVGRIGAPYGVKGWVHVQSFTDPADNLAGYVPWYTASAESGPWRCLGQPEIKRHKGGLIALIDGTRDRDAAGALRGQWIGVEPSAFAESADGHYLFRDLEGCSVATTEAVDLGVVDHLVETGAHAVLVIAGGGRNVLVPFVPEYVAEVDLEQRQIVVRWDASWT